MKPKEGTILTVASGIADKAAELALEEQKILRSLSSVQLFEHADEVLQTDAGDASGLERSRGSGFWRTGTFRSYPRSI